MLLLRVTKVNEGFLYLVCLAVVSLAVFLYFHFVSSSSSSFLFLLVDYFC